jgi:hypothetical protein
MIRPPYRFVTIQASLELQCLPQLRVPRVDTDGLTKTHGYRTAVRRRGLRLAIGEYA